MTPENYLHTKCNFSSTRIFSMQIVFSYFLCPECAGCLEDEWCHVLGHWESWNWVLSPAEFLPFWELICLAWLVTSGFCAAQRRADTSTIQHQHTNDNKNISVWKNIWTTSDQTRSRLVINNLIDPPLIGSLVLCKVQFYRLLQTISTSRSHEMKTLSQVFIR